MKGKLDPIGVWPISNTLAVELIEVEFGIDDVAVIREPHGKISEHIIEYDDEGQPFITVGMLALPFEGCQRL